MNTSSPFEWLIDIEAVRRAALADDLAWTRQALREGMAP